MAPFTPAFLEFLAELEANNNREWFHANKLRFKEVVEKPFHAFVGLMIERISAHDPRIAITPKEAVFRIYRDTRFSKDKTPYKTHMAAVIGINGRKGPHSAGQYIQIGASELRLYGGAYMPDKQALYRIREAIAAQPERFEQILNAAPFREKYGGEVHGEKNKRLPPEFAEAAQRQPLLFNKSFYFFAKLPAETILREDLPEICTEYYLAGKPLGDFLTEAILPNP